MSKFLVKSAFCAGAILALGVTAHAASPYSLPGTSVVIPVGDRDSHYRPDVNAYGPTILHDDDYLYEPHTAGADEMRELQRMFPQTNWPSSMRYYERP